MVIEFTKESARDAIKAFKSIKSMKAPPGAEEAVIGFLEAVERVLPSKKDYEANKNRPSESSKQKRRKKLLKKEKTNG